MTASIRNKVVLPATLALPVFLVGCGLLTPSGSGLPIQTMSGLPPAGGPVACAGVGLPDSVLRADPSAREPLWLESVEPWGLPRLLVRWPHGFTANVEDGIVVLRDETGIAVAKSGDLLTGIGGSGGIPGDGDRSQIWEFNGRRYDCY
jgi:hypothetical protein